MTGVWDAGCAPLRCGVCGMTDVTLFHIPGGWDALDPREGLCLPCGTGDGRHQAAFREHFGEVRFVSDSDAGQGETPT